MPKVYRFLHLHSVVYKQSLVDQKQHRRWYCSSWMWRAWLSPTSKATCRYVLALLSKPLALQKELFHLVSVVDKALKKRQSRLITYTIPHWWSATLKHVFLQMYRSMKNDETSQTGRLSAVNCKNLLVATCTVVISTCHSWSINAICIPVDQLVWVHVHNWLVQPTVEDSPQILLIFNPVVKV